jgi:hypothetical protein
MRCSIFILIAATCAAVMFCGCGQKKSILAKTFLGTGFEPELALRHQGLTVKASRFSNGATDLVEKCDWHSWQGVVSVPGDTNACLTVSRVIATELNRAVGPCQDELTTQIPQAGQPFWGSLYHDEAGARVSVRVWLVPHEESSTISYVIYLRAADLPK